MASPIEQVEIAERLYGERVLFVCVEGRLSDREALASLESGKPFYAWTDSRVFFSATDGSVLSVPRNPERTPAHLGGADAFMDAITLTE